MSILIKKQDDKYIPVNQSIGLDYVYGTIISVLSFPYCDFHSNMRYINIICVYKSVRKARKINNNKLRIL